MGGEVVAHAVADDAAAGGPFTEAGFAEGEGLEVGEEVAFVGGREERGVKGHAFGERGRCGEEGELVHGNEIMSCMHIQYSHCHSEIPCPAILLASISIQIRGNVAILMR
jgi:hypothetical protein